MELRITPGVDVRQRVDAAACHATWLVFASDEEHAALAAAQWPGASARLSAGRGKAEELFHRRTWRQRRGWEVGTVSGRCAFLGGDGRCEVVCAGRSSLLPSVCLHQPFRFTRLPDEDAVTVGVDWSSPGVTLAFGTPLEALRPELAARAQLDGAIQTTSQRVQLGRKSELGGWEDFRAAETAILALLENEKLPLSVAVAAVAAVPRLAEDAQKLLARFGTAAAEYSMSRYFLDQMGGRQEPFRAQIAEVAAHVPDRARGRRRLADIVTLLTASASGRLRLPTHLEILGNHRRNRRGRDEFRWRALPQAGNAAALGAVVFPIGLPELADLLRGYLAHVVRRRLLLPQAGLWFGTSLLAAIYALIREVSRALALADGAPAVAATHLRHAISLVEATVTLDEAVAGLLAHPSPLRASLERIFRPRGFAPSVVLPLDPQGGEIPGRPSPPKTV